MRIKKLSRSNGFASGLLRQVGQRSSTALREKDVAMAVGIAQAPFVTEQTVEGVFDAEQVVKLFSPPPVIFAATIVMVRHQKKVHGRGVERIAIGVEHGTVPAAVAGSFRVPVHVAAIDVIGLA